MKKPEMKFKLSRRIFNLCVICLIFGGVLFAWQTIGKLQSNDGEKTPKSNSETTAKTNDKAVSIHSARRGNPFINFTDGTDLISPNEANGGQPKNLASADFDSDGIADLITADASGTVKFYRGNLLRRGEGETGRKGDEEAFALTDKSFALNISADFLFTGDFNADGLQDVLATARGANFLAFLSGDGRGNFSQPNAVAIDGNITALTTGEIGRKDGQTDVAVSVTNKNGAFLLVFEHPESAFKHKPEAFKLSAPATEIAIGNLDEDFYADIAVASGNILTNIHGRGQAYPWDLIPTSGIKRPNAVVATRQLPFAISALTVGKFGSKRGQTLAILGQDGNIYRLEPNRQEKPSNNKLPEQAKTQAVKNLFVPTDAEFRNFATLIAPQMSREEAEKNGVAFVDTAEISDGKYAEYLQKKQEEAAEKYKNADKKELEKMIAEGMPKTAEQREKAKQGFLRSISGKPSTLAKWSIETLVADSQFANISASNSSQKMLRVNVSSGNLDDILLLDSIGNQIQLVSQSKTEDQSSKTKIVNLETEGNPLAVLPMRLNTDALSDLVVLRSGATVPSVVMTAPANTFTVTSTDDTGDCQTGNPCSLRSAILLANTSIGVDTINFSVATITPTSELPVITEGVNIFGSLNGSGQPSVEITGVNVPAPADGLKIRTIDTFVFGIAVNSFKSVPDGNGSLIGGNGITIESTIGSPGNGNNTILGTFLGTDTTGNVDKGNDATGLNIFDADDNEIIQNVISGNNGAGISVVAGISNLFLSNIIGLNAPGTGKLGNGYGLFFTGSDNVFGGNNPGDGNTVSGNGTPYPNDPGNRCRGYGMLIPVLVNEDFELLTFNNLIQGNRFGTNPAGTLGLGNCSQAIQTVPLTGTVIGSITEGGRNVISDNGLGGVYCGFPFTGTADETEFGFCFIAGNNIGTDITGTLAIPNDLRNILSGVNPSSGAVLILNNQSLSNVGAPGGTTPGGNCTGFCNLISGNYNPDTFDFDGAILGGGVGIIGIFNNYVGTNKSGNQALPNGRAVSLYSTISANFAPTFFLGAYGLQNGEPVSLGNLISGNRSGITMGVGSQNRGDYFVFGNRIGTDATGTFAVPNLGGYGGALNLLTGFGNNVQIGSTNPLGRNIISGNGGDGIGILSGVNVNIVNNLIGLNSSLNLLGNGRNGIVTTGYYTKIGGSAQEANQIYANGTSGANFAGVLVANGAYGTTIRQNSISNNSGLGIDLSPNGLFVVGDGVTENDCQDTDVGANNFQNYPTLYAPTQNGDGTLTVTGFLRSKRNQTFTLDFYRSQMADASTYGEGAALIGSTTVMTDGNGFVEFSFTSGLPVSTSMAITATATDALGNTSEFSCAAGVCASNLTQEMRRQLEIQCSEPIEVNVETDEPDANTGDGLCDINTSDEIIQCTLRAAIQEANARPGYNQIKFAIPGGGVHTISVVGSNLPEINGSADIDATSQSGYLDSPLIKLDGGNLGGSGLKATGNSITISGISIVGFGTGIDLRNSVGANVNKCHLGVNADGETFPAQMMSAGIVIRDGGGGNVIGGYQETDRNIISNNEKGILLISSNENFVVNNIIGLNRDTNAAIPNEVGISIESSNGNRIGGDETESNFIGGNSDTGIVVANLSKNNKIVGNYLGFSPFEPENSTLGNRADGISLESGATNNYIGSAVANERNYIGFSQQFDDSAGIYVAPDSGVDNFILGNNIGVYQSSISQTYYPIPNRTGVLIRRGRQFVGKENEPDNHSLIALNLGSGIVVQPTVGNAITGVKIYHNDIGVDGNAPIGNGGPGIFFDGNVSQSIIDGNVISGNANDGITINGGYENRIVANRIGTNSDGNAPIPNLFNGIKIDGNNNQIGDQGENGNVISGNSQTGVVLAEGSVGNTLRQNFIGTNEDGTAFIRNLQGGVLVGGSENILKENLISGNANFGVAIGAGKEDPPDQNNRLIANKIGTTADGQTALANGFGIFVSETARTNVIEKGNLISGNNRDGIRISPGATETFIVGNLIGTTADGESALGNQENGVYIFGRTNFVGGSTDEDVNVISGNLNGIVIEKNGDSSADDGRLNLITNNLIGLNSSGTQAIANQNDGILLLNGANYNKIGFSFDVDGNPISGTANFIAGNYANGIRVFTDENAAEASNFNIIAGNEIGVAIDEITALANENSGIAIINSPHNIIGSVDILPANVISGNAQHGILIEDIGAFENHVINNHIGITTGGATLANGLDGLRVNGSPGTVVTNNNIGGNLADGIVAENIALSRPTSLQTRPLPSGDDNLSKFFRKVFANLGESTHSIEISGNRIGVFVQSGGTWTSVPNGQNGIRLSYTQDALIGGTQTNSGNTIRNNGGAGVRLDETAGNNNLINHNSILGNTGLGIDLGTMGQTPNDTDDADEGANRGQNYPEIVSRQIVGGELIINFKIDSAPDNSNYGAQGLYVEFFKADNSGEGEKFLGFTYYTVADHDGSLAGVKTVNLGNINTLGINANDLVTATATDADNNTSEFFPPFAPTAANVTIGGKVLTVSGQGIGNVRVILTDQNGTARSILTNSFGNYRFENVEVGQLYTISVSHKKYRFETPAQVVQIDDTRDDLNFTASP